MIKDLLQPSHLVILAVLVVILFGWKKLPDAARSVGRSMRIFKSEVEEMKNDGKESRPSPAATDTVRAQVPSAATPAANQAPPVSEVPTAPAPTTTVPTPAAQDAPPTHDSVVR